MQNNHCHRVTTQLQLIKIIIIIIIIISLMHLLLLLLLLLLLFPAIRILQVHRLYVVQSLDVRESAIKSVQGG